MEPIDPGLISLEMPARQILPLVVAVPHAGRDYGPSFTAGTRLAQAQLRQTEDAFADQLAAQAPGLGAPLLIARFPRIWLDVNRDSRELDPLLIEGGLPEGTLSATNNVRSGLGVVPRLMTGGHAIYAGRLPLADIESRLLTAWHPYHKMLSELIERTRQDFGSCLLIDCHSMPSSRELEPLDIVLGDNFGSSCDDRLMAETELFFSQLGFRLSRNQPYAGGYTTRHYGQPQNQVYALQIEIRRSLYMDERLLEAGPGLDGLARHFGALFTRLGRLVQSWA